MSEYSDNNSMKSGELYKWNKWNGINDSSIENNLAGN